MATQTKLFTYDDYLKLPSDSFKHEVIGGELINRESPPIIHQRIVGNLLVSFMDHIKKNNLGEVFSRLDVVLSMTDIVQPDLLFVARERSKIITEKNVVSAPDLVVEIVSEDTLVTDRNAKKDLYEKYRVKEYWIVDPDEKQITQYVLQDGAFISNAQLNETEKLTSKIINGFTLQLAKVFQS